MEGTGPTPGNSVTTGLEVQKHGASGAVLFQAYGEMEHQHHL